MDQKLTAFAIAVGVALLLALLFAQSIVETVESGTYHVKQAAVTGTLSAKMTPGMYGQWFGSVTKWPVSETFFFTNDSEGGVGDASVEVRFNDGSICKISGTSRIELPRSEKEAIDLITVHGFKTHDEVEDRLILPVIRRSLIMSANLMSAKESYSEKRADFFKFAWDQIENGLYVTKDETFKEVDSISGQQVTRVRKTILLDENGNPQRENNILAGTGIRLSNFEIKNFNYEDRVQKQISAQQEAYMAVQTARANAQKAEQDALTIKAQGEAAVMTAKYEEEQKKVRATVEAQKEAEVAVIAAQKLVDVASKDKETALIGAQKLAEVAAIDLEAAKLEKQRQIEFGLGESERKRLILAADGALAQKLEAWIKAQEVWANAFSNRKVPQVMMGGNGKDGNVDFDAQTFMSLLGIKAAKDLAVDVNIK